MTEDAMNEIMALLTAELHQAWARALADGATPEQIRHTFEQRRRLLQDHTGDGR